MSELTVREICQEFGLTQAALAQRFGIPKRTVEQWCTGKRQPSAYVVSMIVAILKSDAKEEAKSPKVYDKHYYQCPTCGVDLGVSDDDIYVYDATPPNFCSACSQALKWSI